MSPQGKHGSIRTDFDGLKRERVVVLNDTIKSVSAASEAFVSLEDADGQITAALLLDKLLVELDHSIFEEPNHA